MQDRMLVPLIVASALFMQNLDSTVVATALPAIAQDFGANPIHLKLALTTYLLTIAVFLPASGWMADRFGARLVFRAAIAVFMVGSALCGVSHSIDMLVFARIVQGIGGSMMVPVGRLVVLRTVAKSELVAALSWLTVPALVGPILGPPVGGFLTTYASWPWIFWINLPVGVLGIVLATFYVPDLHGEGKVRFDTPGFFLIGLGLAAFMTGSTTLGLNLLPLAADAVFIAGGAALLAAYWWHAKRSDHAILDLSLFRIPTFWHSVIGGSVFRLGIGATPFLLPLLLQLGFGMNAFQSGLITFATAVGAVVMKFTAPQIIRRYGFRNVLVANTVITAVFTALPAIFMPSTSILVMVSLLLIGGFFRSLQFTALNALSFADVEQSQMSQATTITSVGQQISVSLGITVGAIALQIATTAGGGAITWDVFWPAFVTLGVTTLVSIVSFWMLAPDAGEEMSGHGLPPGTPSSKPAE
jgi:EmrB/QacA subfamily drug resistance transporter